MKYHNIETNNMDNGDGLRVLLWVSGCSHNCKNCQNPITHDPQYGVDFDDTAIHEIIDKLSPDYIKGITITGGDPLCYYPEEILELMIEIRRIYGDTKDIWIYTGYTLDFILDVFLMTGPLVKRNVYRNILALCDVLCDGPYLEEFKSIDYKWVGSTNQRVIDMKKTMETKSLVCLDETQRPLCTRTHDKTNALLKEASIAFNR